MAHVIHRGRRLLHPQDEHLAGNPFGDRGWLPLCPGCVTQIGAEWCYEVEPELR